MTGAGISVAAGIPDFRTPGTGLYDNLQKYNLPHPTAIFEIDYLKTTPEPFFVLAKEMYPGNFKPTRCHYFIKLLHEKGVLLRNFTQNIDTLERVANIPAEKLVEAHGSFAEAHCINCHQEADKEWIKGEIFSNKVPRCSSCGGITKPDIVFFGEGLPKRFFELMSQDFPKCDLLLVIGTSLQVQPFASLIHHVGLTTPRLLINNEIVGNTDLQMVMRGFTQGFRFDMDGNYRDVKQIGDLQQSIDMLASLLGWKDDLDALIAKESNTNNNAKY